MVIWKMSLDNIVTTRLAILLDVNEEGLPEILIDKPEISVDITDIIILKPIVWVWQENMMEWP